MVEIHFALHIVSTLFLNYPNFLDSCLLLQFSALVDFLQVIVDSAHIHAKQLCHTLLRQPKSAVLIPHLYAHTTRIGGVEQYIACYMVGIGCRYRCLPICHIYQA